MAASFNENGIEDDEYIDMEITSFSNFFSNARASREFEFQMSSLSMEREPTTSPADELFYKGKLLPLHLPPHLGISESGSGSAYSGKNGVFEEFYGTPLATVVTTTPTSTSTPFESCNVSACESCSVSRELNPAEYSFYENEYSAEMDVSHRWIGGGENLKKSWTRRLRLSSRLKASGAYLKSVFGKSSCSYESSAVTKDGDRVAISNPKPKLSQFGERNQDKGKKLVDDGRSNLHRRSFSMAIKRHSSTNKSSTSSSSSSSSSSNSNSNSNGSKSNSFQSLQSLRRSGSVNAKIESPIQGAIAHCKRSQMSLRKPTGDAGLFSVSASNMAACEDQERPDLWRG